MSKEYKNTHKKLKIKCDKNHVFDITWGNFQSGVRCPYCAGNAKKTIDEIKQYVDSFGYTLLSKKYKNATAKLKIKCDKGHEFEMSWHCFYRGQRCPVCWYESSSSKAEQEIQEYIAKIYNGVIVNNDRNTILNENTGYYLELDVYLPELSKAIEYNGIYWHSKFYHKAKDEIKIKQCKEKNIDLLIINEENYIENKETCLKKIKTFIKQ